MWYTGVKIYRGSNLPIKFLHNDLTAKHAEAAETFRFVLLNVLSALCGKSHFGSGFAESGIGGF
jgi:hypothetical protein